VIDFTVVASRAATLRRCRVFSALPPDTVQFLAEIVREQRFAPGETICQEGEAATEVFVVERGEVSIRRMTEHDPLQVVRPGELFGEFGMFGRGVRLSTVVADTETVLLSLDYERFRKFLLQFPESALALLQVAVSRFVDFGV
jgi:CRP-like cAMP-binding protein